MDETMIPFPPLDGSKAPEHLSLVPDLTLIQLGYAPAGVSPERLRYLRAVARATTPGLSEEEQARADAAVEAAWICATA
jgi:hypothetical protein